MGAYASFVGKCYHYFYVRTHAPHTHHNMPPHTTRAHALHTTSRKYYGNAYIYKSRFGLMKPAREGVPRLRKGPLPCARSVLPQKGHRPAHGHSAQGQRCKRHTG